MLHTPLTQTPTSPPSASSNSAGNVQTSAQLQPALPSAWPKVACSRPLTAPQSLERLMRNRIDSHSLDYARIRIPLPKAQPALNAYWIPHQPDLALRDLAWGSALGEPFFVYGQLGRRRGDGWNCLSSMAEIEEELDFWRPR